MVLKLCFACDLIYDSGASRVVSSSSCGLYSMIIWATQSHSLATMSASLTSPSTKFLLSSPSSLLSMSNKPKVWRGGSKKTCMITSPISVTASILKDETKQGPGRLIPIRQLEEAADPFGGRVLLQDRAIYCQNISIRASEIDGNGKMSVGALVRRLQDTMVNHFEHIGILVQGLGSTSELSRNDLIWVVSTVQIDAEHYPSWGDTVQVHTWFYASGKNALGCNWLLYDVTTGEILLRANSVFVLMNKKTRRISRFLKEIKGEFGRSLTTGNPIINSDTKNKSKLDTDTADYLSAGLKPRWSDMDLNEHVNYAKYIDWILESIPQSFVACHELSAINLCYLKECHMNSVLQSMSKMVNNSSSDFGADDDAVEFEHLLRLEDGSQILKARTLWKPYDHNHNNYNFIGN